MLTSHLTLDPPIFISRWSGWYGTELEPRCQVPEDELEDMRMIGRQTKDILDKHSEFKYITIYFKFVVLCFIPPFPVLMNLEG